MRRCCRAICISFMMGLLILAGCDSREEEQPEEPLRDNTVLVLETEASGTQVLGNEVVEIDVSNATKGYVMLTYTGTNEKTKLQIAAPDEVTYTYLITECSTATAFPLTGGDGSYQFFVYESVDLEEDLYALAFSESFEVQLENEFSPYLTPNVYVSYTQESDSVKAGKEMAEGSHNELEVIEHIYLHVTNNITYDEEKAQSVEYGYIPVPDETLLSGKGICFDYASLMTAMLRSQRIPTKLEVGYAGEIYHAWISCYIDEIGWVDNIIEFDGEHWSLMDPTLAANNSSESVKEYIGDGSKYVIKYTY